MSTQFRYSPSHLPLICFTMQVSEKLSTHYGHSVATLLAAGVSLDFFTKNIHDCWYAASFGSSSAGECAFFLASEAGKPRDKHQ